MGDVTEDPTNYTTHDLVKKTTGRHGISPETKLILAFNILTAITAFLGNVLIIVSLPKASSLHPHSKLLFRCLAITDLCVGLITQPLYVSFLLMTPGLSQRRLVIVIHLINITSTIFGGVSVFTVTAISVDRLLALLLDQRYRFIVTLKRVRVLIFVFWFSSSASAMMFFYNHAIAIGITSMGLLLCIFASTFCYSKIYLSLRQHQGQVQVYFHQRQLNRGKIQLNIARYKKTVSSALSVQMALLACYLPYATIIGIYVITRIQGLTLSLDIAWNVTLSLYYFNSTLNPFLYCWKIKAVRQAVMDTVRKFNCF
ncbi:melanocyte-stimulating hormone receptor-like [Oculina patagonica]